MLRGRRRAARTRPPGSPRRRPLTAWAGQRACCSTRAIGRCPIRSSPSAPRRRPATVEGRFAFATSVPVNYDLVIASPDRDARDGLSGPDPARSDRRVRRRAPSREPVHKATIAVTLAGVDAAQGSLAGLLRLGARVRGAADKRARQTGPLAAGGAVGRRRHGLGRRHRAVDAPGEAHHPAGDVRAASGHPARRADGGRRAAPDEGAGRAAPVAHRRRCRRRIPASIRTTARSTACPAWASRRTARNPAQVAYDIPDLSGFGLQLCAHGFQWNPYLHSERVQCGVAPGKRRRVDADEPAGLQVAGLGHARDAGHVVQLDAGAGRASIDCRSARAGSDVGASPGRDRHGADGGGLAGPAGGRRRLSPSRWPRTPR